VDTATPAAGTLPRPSRSEQVKHLVIGSPLEPVVGQARRMRARYLRMRAPELAEIWAEPARVDAAVRRLVQPGHNVLDIGAHLGSFTSLASRVSPTGSHIAIEALPYKADWLRRKFPRVHVESVAVSDCAGTVTFHHNVGRSGYSGIDAHAEAGDRVVPLTVRTARIDDIVPVDHRIDFVKIDVEGGELRALTGAPRVLEARPPVLFECTSGTTDQPMRRLLYDFFVDRGYRVHMIGAWLAAGSDVPYDDFEAAMVYPFRAFNWLAIPEP
jgi:FkbM family methyltransferase